MIADGEAALIIQSEILSTSEISAVLGLEPTRRSERGEPISAKSTNVRDHSTWILRVAPKYDQEDQSGFGAMRSLLATLAEAGVVAKLDRLRDSCRIRLDWYGSSDSSQGGFVIPSDVLEGLAALRCDLWGTADFFGPISLGTRLVGIWRRTMRKVGR